MASLNASSRSIEDGLHAGGNATGMDHGTTTAGPSSKDTPRLQSGQSAGLHKASSRCSSASIGLDQRRDASGIDEQ
jgi:hypothetical protein